MKKKETIMLYIYGFIYYMKETWLNKLLYIVMLYVSYLLVEFSPDKDGTGLVFVAFLLLPIFFTSENILKSLKSRN